MQAKYSPRGDSRQTWASNFGNRYGRLDMVQDADGDYFLVMGDCMGDDYFGPLTVRQIEAFHTLAELS